jgi:hypothetical protein
MRAGPTFSRSNLSEPLGNVQLAMQFTFKKVSATRILIFQDQDSVL